jgi:hypothetical protein
MLTGTENIVFLFHVDNIITTDSDSEQTDALLLEKFLSLYNAIVMKYSPVFVD